jgi:hypothetical protein
MLLPLTQNTWLISNKEWMKHSMPWRTTDGLLWKWRDKKKKKRPEMKTWLNSSMTERPSRMDFWLMILPLKSKQLMTKKALLPKRRKLGIQKKQLLLDLKQH